MIKKILSLFLIFAIAFSMSTPAFAADIGFSDFVSGAVTFGEWATQQTILATQLIGSAFDGDICPSGSIDDTHDLQVRRTTLNGVVGNYYVCTKCGFNTGVTFEDSYSSYVSTLETPSISSDDFTGTASTYLYNGVELPDINTVWTDKETYPNAYIIDYSSFGFIELDLCQGLAVSNKETTRITFPGLTYRLSLDSNAWVLFENVTASKTSRWTYYPLIWASVDVSGDIAASDPVSVGGSGSSSLPDESTRLGPVMQTINNYNIDNSYTDNSTTVNYFIGSLADDGSVSDIYAPNLFDEDTMVFTDPETSTEYQAAGWLYNYETRTYGIAFDSGVLTVNDTGVDYVRLTYGDNAVTVEYFQGDAETLVGSSSYAYVMASQSACNINGHSYSVETTKEPTCIASGERTYTCSVCGNQYVEEISKTDHTYADYTITQEPTCTAGGIASYTCSTCGAQITEKLDALGHDWLPTSITDESWAVPDDVHCPSCSGTTYSYDRSDYEVVLGGKNYFDLSVLSGRTLDRFVFDDADSFVLSFLAGNGFAGSKMRLRELAPYLVVGRTYTLSFDTESSNNFIFLAGFDRTWLSSTSLTMTDEILDSLVAFYGMNSDKGDPATDCRISNIQIELGTEATSYEPYREDEIELIPPIYHFTCDDCSNTWDAEAVYQYAYTTFTCSRCDETMIQSEEPPMEEQDWFLDFGDTITSFGKNALKAIGFGVSKVLGGFVDLIGGIFGFLDETIIGGVKDFFFSLSDSSITDVFRQENSDGSTTTALPDGMASVMSSIAGFFTGLPTEIRGILTFGIAFLFLVAALMLML